MSQPKGPRETVSEALPSVADLEDQGFKVTFHNQKRYMILEAGEVVRELRERGASVSQDDLDSVEDLAEMEGPEPPPGFTDAYEIKNGQVIKRITGRDLDTLNTRICLGFSLSGKTFKRRPNTPKKPDRLPIARRVSNGEYSRPTPKAVYLNSGFSEVNIGDKNYIYKMVDGQLKAAVWKPQLRKRAGEIVYHYGRIDDPEELAMLEEKIRNEKK